MGLRKDYIGFYKPEKAFGFYSKSNVKHCCSVAKLYLTLLRPRGLEPASPLSMALPDKNTGVGCHFLPQGLFPTQGLNMGPLDGQEDSLPWSHQGSPIESIAGFLTREQ